MKKLMFVMMLMLFGYACAGEDDDSCTGTNTNTHNCQDIVLAEVYPQFLPIFSGYWQHGYGYNQVKLQAPITTSVYARGQTTGFITFDIQDVDWQKAFTTTLNLQIEKSNLDEAKSDYIVSVWETADEDYETFGDCGCGLITTSPPTYGCLPEGCGYLIDGDSFESPIMPFQVLATFTLKKNDQGLLEIKDSDKFMHLLKNNFQGKEYLTLEIGYRCNYMCLDSELIISSGQTKTSWQIQPELVITEIHEIL